jgi:hypothetical protein
MKNYRGTMNCEVLQIYLLEGLFVAEVVTCARRLYMRYVRDAWFQHAQLLVICLEHSVRSSICLLLITAFTICNYSLLSKKNGYGYVGVEDRIDCLAVLSIC